MEERCAQYLINSTWDSCVVTVFELLQGSVIHNNSITQKLNLGSFFLFKKMYLDILDFHMNSCLQMTFPEQVTDLMISSKMLHVFSIITEETEAKVHVSSQR